MPLAKFDVKIPNSFVLKIPNIYAVNFFWKEEQIQNRFAVKLLNNRTKRDSRPPSRGGGQPDPYYVITVHNVLFVQSDSPVSKIDPCLLQGYIM